MSTAAPVLPPTLAANPRLAGWIGFQSDGTVTMRSGKVELGQGIVSAIAQIAAEELDVDYTRIRPLAVDTRFSPNEGSTTGSRSIQEGGVAMRQACAEVRHLFVQAAALRLGVAAQAVQVSDGRLHVPGTTLACSYWQLAAEVDLDRPATGLPQPKAATDYRQIGQSLQRLEMAAKLGGGAFIQDVELPGMLHGRVVRPASFRARLQALDEAPARALPGVHSVVRRGSFLGVVAEREEQAVAALRTLAQHCEWAESADLPDVDRLPDWLCSQPAEHEVLRAASAASAAPGRRLAARYTRPYLAHASIGPSCALAWWHDGLLEFWSHSQSMHALRDEIAKVLHLPKDSVVGHHAEGAGCYGHNGADDVALDAALLAAAAAGRPVRVQWMREDEFAWEPLGPAMLVQLAATVTPDGRVADWDEQIWGNRHIGRPGRHPRAGLLAAWHFDEGLEPPDPVDMPLHMGGGSQRNAVPYYDFAAVQVHNHAVQAMPVRVSALRALGAHLNVYAIECFMDELARAASVDPVAFRLRHLSDPRARAVIEAAVARAGGLPAAAGDGTRGVGLAFARYKNIGNYVAVVAEVELAATVRVTRVVAAVDCGLVINPDGVRNQCEGGIVQAISWTLKEQMRFDDTRLTTLDWASYPILRFSEVPRIEIELINRPQEESLGAGEGMTGPTAAAVGNAVAHAMGVRVRDMPLTPERIVAAMDGN